MNTENLNRWLAVGVNLAVLAGIGEELTPELRVEIDSLINENTCAEE